uniref:Uncharacterized protein n=1 Tax=Setaria italica TaxID=4555 RepID=K3YNV2_SETIT
MITLLFITNFLLMCCLVKRGFLQLGLSLYLTESPEFILCIIICAIW